MSNAVGRPSASQKRLVGNRLITLVLAATGTDASNVGSNANAVTLIGIIGSEYDVDTLPFTNPTAAALRQEMQAAAEQAEVARQAVAAERAAAGKGKPGRKPKAAPVQG